MKARRVDLNVDIGEGFPHDAELIGIATSANVCCGRHAGDPDTTCRTVDACRSRGVRVGAHPGFPDRASMGRRMPSQFERVAYFASVREQIAEFRSQFEPAYVKPHGALYQMLSGAIHGEAERYGVELGLDVGSVMALPGTPFAAWLGDRLIAEGFADRAYLPDGRLVPRSEPRAVLRSPAEVAAQAVALAARVHSVCLHGDTSECVDLARHVRRALEAEGWEVGL